MSNLYHPDFQPGTAVKVVNYNPKNPDPEDPNPNGHTGVVEEFEDTAGALSARILGLVRVRIPSLPSDGHRHEWWALLPSELERV